MKQKPNKHNAKLKKARRMMNGFEVRNAKKLRIGPFDCKGWREHAAANERKQTLQRTQAEIRRKYKAKKINQ